MVFLCSLHQVVFLLRRFGATYCLCLHYGWIGSGGQCNDWSETYSELRPAIFWDFVYLTVVVCYQRFFPTLKVQADCLALEDGSDGLARNVGNKISIPGEPEITSFLTLKSPLTHTTVLFHALKSVAVIGQNLSDQTFSHNGKHFVQPHHFRNEPEPNKSPWAWRQPVSSTLQKNTQTIQ